MKCWLQIDPEEFEITAPLPLSSAHRVTSELAIVCDEQSVLAALHNKQITVEQAVWLHNHNKDWEITA